MAMVQVLISGACLFALFYFLLRTIGPVQLGIWSVVLAGTSTARLSELGMSGGVVKFVARYRARSDEEEAGAVIETAALSIGGFTCLMMIPTYTLVHWLLRQILPVQSLPDAFVLLPFALVSLWMTLIGGVFLSGLDGILRTDLRSVVVVSGTALHLCLVLALVPSYGLMGLAWAQVGQATANLIVSWLLLRRAITVLPVLPFRWKGPLFREMFRYSVNFQFTSIAQILFDPTSKALLSKFGGLDVVTYYDIANRMVLQFRSLSVSASQVVVPIIAGMHEAAPARIQSVYSSAYRLLLYLALPLFGGVVAVIPLVSEFWIGHYEPLFATFATALTVGWFVNTLAGPAYFSNLGTGRLRPNTLAHLVIGLLNGIIGTALGLAFGGTGVVVGFVLALVIGSSIIVCVYHRENRIELRELVPREYWSLAVATVIAAGLTWGIYHAFRDQFVGAFMAAICTLTFLGIVVPSLWMHPMRSRLVDWIVGIPREAPIAT